MFDQVATLATKRPRARRLLEDHYAFFNAARRRSMIRTQSEIRNS
jgi:hypothetical protein